MKQLGIAMILLIFIPAVGASTFLGWITIPEAITVHGYIVEIKDIGTDGSLYVEISNASVTKPFKLYPGDSASLGFTEVTLNKTFIGTGGHALVEVSFPYILIDESIYFNDYNFTLLSVDENGFKARVSTGNVSKEFSSKDFIFGDLKFHVEPYPKIFDGYLERGKSIEYFGHAITFESATVENTTNGYVERVVFRVDGVAYEVNVGENLNSRIFHVKTEDLKGGEYLKITVNLRGAYVAITSSPDFEGYVYEGKDVKIGPFLVRVDRVFEGQAYLSIRNECGQELAGGLVNVGGTPLRGIAHRGLEVAVESISSDSNGVKAKLIAFVDWEKIPKIEDISWLDVMFNAPENVSQYMPFEATVTLKNLGTSKLKNIKVKYERGSGVEVLSRGETFLDELAPGKSATMKLILRINSTGEKNLGKITASADVPYELGCGGYTTLTFNSNFPIIHVLPVHIAYSLSLELPNVSIAGEPFTGVLRVRNEGNIDLPVVVEIPLDNHFAPISSDMDFESGYLRSETSIGINETKEYHFTLVGITPGNWTITPRVIFGRTQVNSTAGTIEILSPVPNVTTTVTVTQTIPQIVEVPKIIKENVTTEVVPLKGKLMWMGVGILIGAGVIILIAWYKAQKS